MKFLKSWDKLLFDILAIVELICHYNDKIGQTNWDVKCDKNSDGVVNIYDLISVSEYIDTGSIS